MQKVRIGKMAFGASKGDRFYLRSPTQRDAAALAAAINFPEVASPTAGIPNPYGLKDAQWFIIDEQRKRRDGSSFAFSIFRLADRRLVGGVGLHNTHLPDTKHRLAGTAELGYWLTPSAWGRGIMPKAAGLLLSWSFDVLHLERVYATVFVDNLRSVRVLMKLGFQLEGIRRQHTVRHGKRGDDLIFGLLKGELKTKM